MRNKIKITEDEDLKLLSFNYITIHFDLFADFYAKCTLNKLNDDRFILGHIYPVRQDLDKTFLVNEKEIIDIENLKFEKINIKKEIERILKNHNHFKA